MKPTVGLGVTRYRDNDKQPFTVIKVISESMIIVQRDRAVKNADGEYEYFQNQYGDILTISLRADGKWRILGYTYGSHFTLGKREMVYLNK